MSNQQYTIDQVRNVFRILQNFRSPDASRWSIEKFYGRPSHELYGAGLPDDAIDGDPYVRDKLNQFEHNPLEWVLSLDKDNFNRLVDMTTR